MLIILQNKTNFYILTNSTNSYIGGGMVETQRGKYKPQLRRTDKKCYKGQYGGNWSKCYLCPIMNVGERIQTIRHYPEDRTLVS